MGFFDSFRNSVTLDKDAYHLMLREGQDLRDDKKRLQGEVDELKALLAKERDENAGLVNELKNSRQAKEITPDVISRRLGIPLAMLDQIDLERLGVQMGKKQ